jgi:hypothetical protein
MVSDIINLYLALKKILGEAKEAEVFKRLYDEGMQCLRKYFPGGKLPVGEIMKRELVSFPLLGFELFIAHEVESNEDVYYEHLVKCPFLTMTKKWAYANCPVISSAIMM